MESDSSPLPKPATATESSSTHRSTRLALVLEAARRANWDAANGPARLRAGRFNPHDAALIASSSDDHPAKHHG